MTPVSDSQDRACMRQALALAALPEGTTSPNPRVGCLLVRDGEVVGRGYHLAPGGPHAEVLAVREAGRRARGATLYVNLEPCAHLGRTPPCAELIVRSGVRRVVAALRDPNPIVDGRGIEILREAGIRVDLGLLAEEAERLNEPFLHWHRRFRPWVTLKAALSADGQLSAAGGVSRWITSEPARRFAHRLRLRADAVLVGAGTVRRDDPRLSVRLPGVRCAPRRVVLSAALDLDLSARLFEEAGAGPPPLIYTSEEASPARVERLAERADVVVAGRAGAGLDLGGVLKDLAGRQVQSLLVEGGGTTFAAFMAAGLADAVALFHSPKLIGARDATPFLDGPAVAEPGRAPRFERRNVLSLGDDILVLGRLVGGARDGAGDEPCSPV